MDTQKLYTKRDKTLTSKGAAPVVLSSVSKRVIAIVAIVIIVVAVSYTALTFPRDVVSFPVAFSVGFDQTQEGFDIPLLNDKAQVTVTVTSGSALWRATIVNQNGDELWTHATGQGDQTTYHSAWISLPSGHYNFTFATIGVGSLNAQISVTSKGGFW